VENIRRENEKLKQTVSQQNNVLIILSATMNLVCQKLGITNGEIKNLLVAENQKNIERKLQASGNADGKDDSGDKQSRILSDACEGVTIGQRTENASVGDSASSSKLVE
jgi:hypothetical protein